MTTDTLVLSNVVAREDGTRIITEPDGTRRVEHYDGETLVHSDDGGGGGGGTDIGSSLACCFFSLASCFFCLAFFSSHTLSTHSPHTSTSPPSVYPRHGDHGASGG